jgi:acyl-CoA thioester hydrolase
METPAWKSYPASTSFRIEYADTDAQGRVFYANFLRFFDRGRVAYWERVGLSAEEIRHLEQDLVIAEIHCTYRAPASFYDPVTVHTRLSHIGRSSLRMEFAVSHDSSAVLMAEGYATLVQVDLASNRALPVAEELKARMLAFEAGALKG